MTSDEKSQTSEAVPVKAARRLPFGGRRALHNVVHLRIGQSVATEPFNAGELSLEMGEYVVAESSKGPVLAETVSVIQRQLVDRQRIGRIIRRATEEDISRHQENLTKAREAFTFCLKRIHERDLSMKLCRVEYMLDSSKVLFYFSADRRIDFRQLVRDLARELNTRIEMRQIGVRDGAGLIGGIGPCGKELCCGSFLKGFRSISIRHAKDQGLTLNPTKVSGMCGRLMCCLLYEHRSYKAARRNAPRVNRAVFTDKGPGRVTEIDLLGEKVRVYLDQGSSEVFPYTEIVVDNDTIRRAGDIPKQAAPSRPKRSAVVSREGAHLEEDYIWDNTEAEEVELPGDKKAKRVRRRQADTTQPELDPDNKPKRRRRRRRRRPNKPDTEGQPSTSPSTQPQQKTEDQQEKPAKKRRRRRRPRNRRPDKGSDGAGPPMPGGNEPGND